MPKEDNSELIQFLSEKFEKVDARLDELSGQFNELQTSVDGYAKRAESFFQEMIMLTNRVNRLEKWIKQLAEHTGVKLED